MIYIQPEVQLLGCGSRWTYYGLSDPNCCLFETYVHQATGGKCEF